MPEKSTTEGGKKAMATLDTVEQTEAKPAQGMRGRPKKGEIKNIDQATRFFEVLKKIPPDAWTEGKAVIKIYRQEPSIDRLASGKAKHIQEYYEPIAGPERIKLDHGSGKYLLFLTYQGPKDGGLRELERTNIDILDMKYPPKVPRGDWLEEPKNSGWLWAFPKETPPPAASPVSQLAETLDVLDGIQDRAAARARPAEAPAAPTQPSMLEIIKTVKEMMPPPTPPATDNKMLDTIVQLMNGQLDRMSRDNADLRKEIAEARKNPETKSALGGLAEIIAEAQKIGIVPADIKSLWGKAEGALQAVTRSRMSGTEEFWQPIVTGLLDSIKPVLPMVVARIANQQQQQRPQQQPQQPGAPALIPAANPSTPPPTNGATEAPPMNPELAQAFFSEFGPALVQWFKEAKGEGGDFAEWIFDGYGPDWKGLKWMHLKQAAGTDNIVRLFQTSPFWPEIAAAADKFTEFLKSFVEWQPEAAQAVVDLEEQEAEEIN
jgi:hypothetical protein